MNVEIDILRPEHARRFAELNRAWLDEYHLMEHSEEAQLAHPQAHFVDSGGQIFVALYENSVVGTCAVLPNDTHEFELAKLTVSPEFRGHGIARRLVERCIAFARGRGGRRVMLVSNSQLQPALRLYESMGFEYRSVPASTKYEVADVCMVLDLDLANAALARDADGDRHRPGGDRMQ
jgi:ribosomal protein S18 acetylase RimI-like enzyme